MKPLKIISSGRAVFRIAYTRIAGTAPKPRPANSDVAVSTPLTEISINTANARKETIAPIVQMSVLFSFAFLIFLRPIHSKKFIFFLAVMSHQINGIRVKSAIWIMLLITVWIKRFIMISPSLLSLYEGYYTNPFFRPNYPNINLSLISQTKPILSDIVNGNSLIK